MKKVILSMAALLLASATTFAQNSYNQATGNTGFTYDCDQLTATTGGLGGDADSITWGAYYPECGFSYENGGGGWDASPVNELKFSWGQIDPGKIYDIMTFATPLDLSNPANQKVKVTLKSEYQNVARPLTYTFHVEKGFNENSIALITPITLNITGTYQVFEFDLSTHIASGQDLSHIDKFIFYYERCPVTGTQTNGDLFMKEFSAGSPLVTGLTNSTAVADANIFPNPSTGITTITGELKTVSDVKVVLVNTLGQEVKTITEGSMGSINTEFDVTSLNKGIYSVVYYINGAPAKSQKLVVR